MTRSNDWYIVDAATGTILSARDCYFLHGEDFPDNEVFASMSDDAMSYYATEHGIPLTLPPTA